MAARPTEQVIPAVETWIAGLDKAGQDYERFVLEGLWQYQTHNVLNEELLKQMLSAKDHRGRAAAVRVLSYWHPRIESAAALLKPMFRDESSRVRAEAVRAASFFAPDEITESVLDVLDLEMDGNLEYLMDETMKVLDPN